VLVAYLLEDEGFEVLTAMSGGEAPWTLAGHEAIHPLLTDLRMPVISGVQLATEANRLGTGVRVLAMAASA
jgi:CheY-like chemotaxis protein